MSANSEPSGRHRLVHALLDAATERDPEATAVRDGGGAWTYRKLSEYSHAVAHWLRAQGVRRGDRVVTQLPTTREAVALLFGASRAGAVLVPLNPGMKPFHLASVIANASPRLVLTAGSGFDEAWEAVEDLRDRGVRAEPVSVSPSDIAFLIYTSGSTAAPKGVVCPHAQVTFATQAITSVLGYRPSDVVLCRFPLSWDYGLYKVLMCCVSGACIVLAGEESDLRLLSRIREVRATVVPVVPSLATMIATLAAREPAGGRANTVRLITNTGAALPQATIDRLRAAFPGVRVVRQFGQTECKRIAIMPPEEDEQRPLAVGRPLPGTKVLILDEQGSELPPGSVGEIVAVGPHVMPGYWQAPELTARAFRPDPHGGGLRLHTGDYGSLDADGYLYFEGRRDDMFKRKGIRMSTLEIEAAALDIPGVRAAGVVPPSGARDLGIVVEGSIASHIVLRELALRLEPQKVPSVCVVVPAIPLTAHGKNAVGELARLLDAAPAGKGVPAQRTAEQAAGSPAPLDIGALAKRYGTPLYVYDLDLVEAGHRALADAVPEEVELYYAVKANPHPDLGRVLALGTSGARPCRAEISSTGELAAALSAGFDPAHCLYTGPGKTAGELDTAIHAGVRTFSVESLSDMRHVGEAAQRLGVEASCLVRVNDAVAGGRTSSAGGARMMGKPSQFGIDSETLPELMPALLAVPGARLSGAHFFTMSNAVDEAALLAEFDRSVGAAARLEAELGLPLDLLDIGGGFSSPYTVPGGRARYPGLRAGLAEVFDRHLPGWRAGRVRLACESGRYLVGESGTLTCRVVNIKDSRGRRFVILDAGINAIGGLSGLGRLLPAAVRPEDGRPALETASLVGPLCTPGDILGSAVRVPRLDEGDLVTIPNVGAYGVTASVLGFLGRPTPVEVAVRGGEVVSVSRIEYRRAYEGMDDAAGALTPEPAGAGR